MTDFPSLDAVEEVAHEARLYPFVEDVRFGQEWVNRLFLLRSIGGFTTAFLGVAFGLVAGLITYQPHLSELAQPPSKAADISTNKTRMRFWVIMGL